MKLFILFFTSLLSIGFSFRGVANAQTNAQNTYISAVDHDLAIKTIVLVPPTDNVGNIYSKPLEEELRRLLNDDKQWSLAEFPKNLKIKSEMLDEQPDEVKKILQAAGSEAALTTRLIKGPRGISISMSLFVGREGLPLLQESISDYQGFEINDIKNQADKLFENIKSRMPFRATILSRRGQQVTLNLGSNYGLKSDSRVSIVQIIKVNRHPKLKFMVSTEKEVLGRVKLFKVEPYLSFGYVELEKDPGVITVGAKVMPDEFVKYALPVTTPSGKVLQDITQRPDKDVAFGDEPKEWTSESDPQFGKIELLAGFSSYSQNAILTTAGSVSGGNNLAPNIVVRGELWLSSEWFVGVGLRQSVFTMNNDLANSVPGKLNMAMSQFGVNTGYNLLLSNEFFGPKLQFTGGYTVTDFKVDDSTPTAFTSMKYGGLLLGIAGQFPLSDDLPIDLGGKLDFYINPSLSESISSGSSTSSKVNDFSFFMNYRMKKRFQIRGELLFETYSSDFSGIGARSDSATSISHKVTTLLAGVEYLF